MNYVKMLSACGLLVGLGAVLPIALMDTSNAHAETTLQRTATFEIAGMVTPSCPMLVKSAARRIKGVISVEVDYAARTASVRYRDGVTSAEAIARVIHDQTGFEARIVADTGDRSRSRTQRASAVGMCRVTYF